MSASFHVHSTPTPKRLPVLLNPAFLLAKYEHCSQIKNSRMQIKGKIDAVKLPQLALLSSSSSCNCATVVISMGLHMGRLFMPVLQSQAAMTQSLIDYRACVMQRK